MALLRLVLPLAPLSPSPSFLCFPSSSTTPFLSSILFVLRLFVSPSLSPPPCLPLPASLSLSPSPCLPLPFSPFLSPLFLSNHFPSSVPSRLCHPLRSSGGRGDRHPHCRAP
ncbi:unnamed protein product [Closterium sp. Naga37s-1]|nr:unnamed protein product [Closterium sp. Naga37s-1]